MRVQYDREELKAIPTLTGKALFELYRYASSQGSIALNTFLGSLSEQQVQELTGRLEPSVGKWWAQPLAGNAPPVSVARGASGEVSTAERIRAMRGGLATSGFGMLSFDTDALISETVRSKGSFDSLVARIISDPRFAKSMPGILDENGNLRMSPREWAQRRQDYRAVAARFGRNVGDAEVGELLAKEISPDEYGFRLNAVQTIKANRQSFEAFNKVLVAEGKQPLRKTSEIYEFIRNRASSDVYRIYESSVIAQAAASAGVDISGAKATAIAKGSPEMESLESALAKFGRISAERDLASAELRAWGLSDTDLITTEFGGPNQAQISAMRDKALRQRIAQAQTTQAAQRVFAGRKGRPVTGISQEPGV